MNYKYDKLNINYDIVGNGPPIIMLHGWGTNYHTFDSIVTNIKKCYTVFLIDLPGFGMSDEPRYIYNLNNYVHFLKTFIEELQIDNPIILGHSFGGRIAIKYASKYENISKLILVDSAGIKKRLSIKKKLEILKYKILKKFYRITKNIKKYNELTNTYGSTDYINSTNIMKCVLSKVVNEDLTKLLKNIKVETLIIWGKDDLTTPYTDAIKMNKYIKNSGLVTIDSAGHFPYLERKKYFNIILNNYLEVDNICK